MLIFENDGADIISTNYFETEMAGADAIYVSCNAGAFRLLLPSNEAGMLKEMAAATMVIVSRGAWPEAGRMSAFELLFEDNSDSPFCIHIGDEQMGPLPSKADEGRNNFICSVWLPGPTKVLALPAAYRRVHKLPYLKPWGHDARV